jgi:hypothetical protein
MVIAICTIVAAAPLSAQLPPGFLPPRTERITSFDVTMSVAANGTVRVREDISVIVQGEEIKRGIYRDFPLLYGPFWQRERGFRVLKLERDGKPEKYKTETSNDSLRVLFGQEDVFLEHGEHRYVFEYETTEQVGHFDRYDELYWNVTGGWAFPIDGVRFVLTVPPGSERDAVNAKAFIGPDGSTEEVPDILIRTGDNDTVVVEGESPRPLAAGEGLTFAVNWPKGLVPDTSDRTLVQDTLASPQTWAGMLLLVGTVVGFGVVWWRTGRDRSRPQPVVVRYGPPEGVTPAMTRFINSMGTSDSLSYTATVLDLAIRGYLKINQEGGTYTLYRTAKDPSDLKGEEDIIYHTFFGHAPYPDPVSPPGPEGEKKSFVESITETFTGPKDEPGVFSVHRSNQAKLMAMNQQLQSYFNGEKKKYVVPNQAPLIFGILAILAFGVFNYLFHVMQWHTMKLFFLLFSSFWNGVVGIFVYSCIVLWMNPARNWGTTAAAVFLTLFLIPFVAVGFVTGTFAYGIGGILALQLTIIALSIYSVALPRRTTLGRKIQDEIDGFLLFVKSQERYMQKVHTSIPEKFSMYEKYLPYAIALDVEPQWSEDFKDTVKAMEERRSSTHHSAYGWYSGSTGFSTGGAFGSSFASSFSSSFSSSVSSSSGSSGGSSGGGGGSSGGGGW